MLVIAAALVGCTPSDLPDGQRVDDEFLVDVSPVRARLDVPCAGATGGHGAYRVAVDDRTGMTALLDVDGQKLWLRDAFGGVPDTCWWLPLEGADPELPDQDCAPGGRQQGRCGPEAEAPAHWRWLAPGVADVTDPIDVLAAVDGTVLLPGREGLARFDLTGTADPPIAPGESPGSRLSFLEPIDLPGGKAFIAAGDTTVATRSGDLRVYRRTDARRDLSEPIARSAVREGALAVGEDTYAVAAASGVDVFDSPDFDRERRDHRSLRDGVIDVTVLPNGTGSGDPVVLTAAGALVVGEDGATAFWPVTGGQGLFLGHPGGVAVPYVWGNDDQGGFVARLDPGGAATVDHTGARLLGAGVGAYFQEIVLVEDGGDDGGGGLAPPVVRGVLDRQHADAIGPGAVGLALAAFVESPKDPEIADAAAADLDLAAVGGCPTTAPEGYEREHAVCCAQQQRGVRLDRQLQWLDLRLHGERPLAVVIGVSPTAVAASRRCEAVDEPGISALGAPLPASLRTWLRRWGPEGVGSAAVFIHSAPFDPQSWWVGCPTLWPENAAPEACWDAPRDDEHYRAFYEDVVAAAALSDGTGAEPAWSLLAGGYGTEVPGGVSWTDVLPDVVLPDGAPAEDGLFFGNLGMNPRAPAALAKELAPDDAVRRAFPVPITSPADRWDGGGEATAGVYWPGQTLALEYLAEQRRSGLLMQEYIQHVGFQTDWADPTYAGDEAADVMTAADFAAAEHYLVTRVLAARDVDGPRWWTLHLGDLSRLRDKALYDGWIDCGTSTDCSRTALDEFADDLDRWPAIEWRSRPE